MKYHINIADIAKTLRCFRKMVCNTYQQISNTRN